MSKTELIIVIMIVILAAWIGWNININPPQQGGQELSIQENSLPMSINYIHQNDNFYNVQVEYPQFQNVDSSFNSKISDLITEKIDSFKKSAKDNYEARKATATPDNPVPENPTQPFDFIASWQSSQINDKYISFVINMYYFVGGAHGANEIHAFNYDLQKEQEITINDFLNSSQQSFDNLAKLANQDVTSQLQSNGLEISDFIKQMIDQGTSPTADNYKNFTFNYNSLTIYFQQYQVAPGAAGSVTTMFYKSVLEANSITSSYLQ
jgi:hypothetical protein